MEGMQIFLLKELACPNKGNSGKEIAALNGSNNQQLAHGLQKQYCDKIIKHFLANV